MVMDNGHEQWSNAFFNLTNLQRTMEGNGTTMAIDQKINQPETISPYTSEPFHFDETIDQWKSCLDLENLQMKEMGQE